jgi:putative PIN family toxin of toxin-antitoxin system
MSSHHDRPFRVVVDTNVLVSALYKPSSVPARALDAIWRTGQGQGTACLLYDARIVDEYRSVLARPKFRALDRERIEELIARVLSDGADLGEVAPWNGSLPDEGDRVFVEVALAGRAHAIVTGNIKHYPVDLGFAVLPSATLLAELGYP